MALIGFQKPYDVKGLCFSYVIRFDGLYDYDFSPLLGKTNSSMDGCFLIKDVHDLFL